VIGEVLVDLYRQLVELVIDVRILVS